VPALLWLLLSPGSWKDRARRAVMWCLAWGAAAVCVLGLRLGVAGVGFGSSAPHAGSFSSALGALLTDLRLLVAPWPLRAAYTSDLARVTLAGLLAGAGMVAATALVARRASLRQASLVGTTWMLAFLLPSLGLVSIHALPVAERFLYLPSVGVVLLAGAMVERLPSRLTWAMCAALILAMAAGTVVRERVWRAEVSLFRDTVQRSPRYATGHAKLGAALLAAGRTDEAFEVLARAWDSGLHDPEIAIVAGVAAARQGEPEDAEVAANIGAALLALGRTGEAVTVLRAAAARHPARPDLWDRLGVALQQEGRAQDAVAAHARALALRPGDPDLLSNAGHALLAAGRTAEAKERFRAALAAHPDDPQARFGWVLVLARTGEVDAARRELPALRAADPQLAALAERQIPP
jgi:Flp pilus assembly protein TadD